MWSCDGLDAGAFLSRSQGQLALETMAQARTWHRPGQYLGHKAIGSLSFIGGGEFLIEGHWGALRGHSGSSEGIIGKNKDLIVEILSLYFCRVCCLQMMWP